MNEILQVIYTHEGGQYITDIPLVGLSNIFISKIEMEKQLLLFWEIIKNTRKLKKRVWTKTHNHKLVKISTCLYSEKMEGPIWYGDWDGKFYYNVVCSQ